VAGAPKGAQAQGQHLLFSDASGFYPLPRGVRTDAPRGHTPVLEEWWTREHLAALSAIAPAGKRYCHGQAHAVNAGEVVACLAHLRREVPGRLVMLWDGAPMPRSQVIREFLLTGAASRLHLERLPA
jgi:hypothetical protein